MTTSSYCSSSKRILAPFIAPKGVTHLLQGVTADAHRRHGTPLASLVKETPPFLADSRSARPHAGRHAAHTDARAKTSPCLGRRGRAEPEPLRCCVGGVRSAGVPRRGLCARQTRAGQTHGGRAPGGKPGGGVRARAAGASARARLHVFVARARGSQARCRRHLQRGSRPAEGGATAKAHALHREQ